MKESSRRKVNGVLAIASAFMLVAFFLPNRGTSVRSTMAGKTAAIIYDGQKITILEQNNMKQEWAEVRSHLYFLTRPDQQRIPLAYILGAAGVKAIDANANAFMVLVYEAHHMDIGVSNDQFQETLRSGVANMPDESDDNYDLSQSAVYDLLLVKNLLDRVGDAAKISQPRALRALAMTQQEISINVVEVPLDLYVKATTQPTTQEVQTQYDRYGQTLKGQTQSSDAGVVASPLGFGYKYPNRVKIQFVGFTHDQIIDAVKKSRPAVEWEVKARQTYRKNTSVFVPGAATPPDWYSLSTDVTNKVYDAVYNAAGAEIAQKLIDRLTEQTSSDWQAYHDAITRGEAPPRSSQGVAFNSNDYLRMFAAGIQRDFGVIPVVEFDDNGFKGPDELSQLKYIGHATDNAGRPFSLCATFQGDEFPEAAQLAASQKLSLWQPSQPFSSGTADNRDGYYIFRLTAMDPSHPATMDQVKDQVEQDVRIQAAWDAAEAEADKIQRNAQTGIALFAAARNHVPPLPILTTDYFNAYAAEQSMDKIPGMTLKPASVREMGFSALNLLRTPALAASGKPLTEVDLPDDHEVALIELAGTRPEWRDQTEELIKLSKVQADTARDFAQNAQFEWASFDQAAKRTSFQEMAKAQ